MELPLLLFILVPFFLVSTTAGSQLAASQADRFFSSSGHTNNWAVLVDTSRYWFNYRHSANTLSMYRTVKRLGIPDSNIILMLADDVACNPRNDAPGSVFNTHERHRLDLYGENIEVDYRGYEVTVENFIRVLTGRHDPSVPRSKRLLTDDRSNVLVYMTGHGGDEFLKFQDNEEISSWDIADAFEQMWEKRRYHEILFMVDTCQANTLYERFYSPNILSVGSSRKGESSYSYHIDMDLGVHVIDRFTFFNLEVLERVTPGSQYTLADLFSTYDPVPIASHPGIRSELSRPLEVALITDFFGAVQNVEITRDGCAIRGNRTSLSEAATEQGKSEPGHVEAAAKPVNVNLSATHRHPNLDPRVRELKPVAETELVSYRFVGLMMIAGVAIRMAVNIERKQESEARPRMKRA
ncbi:hypothetical protein M427DRAFT_110624 [Gonapodya prolifera JEL478]|uniref:GPI-anchor transamidase n=1 Tax=Gonapodya prolifera (strain JEL478) TaxID=1344416 RepID=A0A139AK83_GONPJ|nr:hypothetical protein M427DRAFT_110624 [Gonapodya prolifera JEL478]|eukprot:KXS17176.1 hypothetical protein M427DRAFT_110624 [Gonapodya prolifera JEL478]